MSVPTPYLARVERVFQAKAGRSVRVACPFLCPQRTHVHPWPQTYPAPSSEVLAPCPGQNELRTYAIDAQTAAAKQRDAAATAGKKPGSQVRGKKS